jgi:hypothetical protein
MYSSMMPISFNLTFMNSLSMISKIVEYSTELRSVGEN